MSLLSARPVWAWIALISIQFATLGLSAGWESALAEGLTEQVSDELNRRLFPPELQGQSFCSREALCGQAVLARFYEKRDFQPAWMDGEEAYGGRD